MFIASIIDERAFRVGPSCPAHQTDASHDPFFPLPLGMCQACPPTAMLSRLVTRTVRVPRASRAASTARGLAGVLQKSPDDVIITFAKRTAMGRAKKGQFKDTPADELLLALIKVGSSQHPG